MLSTQDVLQPQQLVLDAKFAMWKQGQKTVVQKSPLSRCLLEINRVLVQNKSRIKSNEKIPAAAKIYAKTHFSDFFKCCFYERQGHYITSSFRLIKSRLPVFATRNVKGFAELYRRGCSPYWVESRSTDRTFLFSVDGLDNIILVNHFLLFADLLQETYDADVEQWELIVL